LLRPGITTLFIKHIWIRSNNRLLAIRPIVPNGKAKSISGNNCAIRARGALPAPWNGKIVRLNAVVVSIKLTLHISNTGNTHEKLSWHTSRAALILVTMCIRRKICMGVRVRESLRGRGILKLLLSGKTLDAKREYYFIQTCRVQLVSM